MHNVASCYDPGLQQNGSTYYRVRPQYKRNKRPRTSNGYLNDCAIRDPLQQPQQTDFIV